MVWAALLLFGITGARTGLCVRPGLERKGPSLQARAPQRAAGGASAPLQTKKFKGARTGLCVRPGLERKGPSLQARAPQRAAGGASAPLQIKRRSATTRGLAPGG